MRLPATKPHFPSLSGSNDAADILIIAGGVIAAAAQGILAKLGE